MQITEIKRYKFNGKEFDSLQKVRDEIDNILGREVVDKMRQIVIPSMNAGQRLAMCRLLTLKPIRETLLKMLSTEIDMSEDELCGNVKSIFDITK